MMDPPGAARAALLAAACLLAAPAGADDRPLRYELDVSVDVEARTLEGRVRFLFRNDTAAPLTSILLFTYPGHYARLDPALTDEIFDRVYPKGVSLAEMTLGEVKVAGRPVPHHFPLHEDLSPGTILEVDLPWPLPPAGAVEVEVPYSLTIPRRFGSFGEFSGDLCLNGGWYPYLPSIDADGTWGVRAPPPIASFSVRLDIPRGGSVILNGESYRVPASSDAPLEVTLQGAFLALLVSPEFRVYQHSCERGEITYFRRLRERKGAEELLSTLHQAIAYLPDRGLELPRVKVRLAEAHLRRDLVMVGEGVTLVSDRFLEVVFLGTKYHLGPVVEGVYGQVFRRLFGTREDSADLPWVMELAAWVWGERFYDDILEGPKTIKGFLTPFGIFPSIDRLLHAPRFPFIRAFYGGYYETDPLREDIARFNSARVQGRVLAEKIRDLLGSEALERILREWFLGEGTLRHLVEAEAGTDMNWFFDQWMQPYPRVNYKLLETRQTPQEGGGYLTEVRIRREGPKMREPVEVEVKRFLGRAWRGRWEGEGEEGTAKIRTEGRIWSTRIDPRKRLWETTRIDNQWPPKVKFLLNRFRVKIDLNGRDHEASVGSTFILNNDYSNRYRLTLFTAEEQDGLALGYKRSFGERIDPTRYRQSGGLGFSYTKLDPDFASRSSGRMNDRGNVTAFSLGYGFSSIQSSRNPQLGASISLGAEYGDRLFGSDFRYWRGSVTGEAVAPLIRDHHILALRADLGVARTEGTPTQLLFDVGGFSGVRGIKTGQFLGHYLWRAKAEYRLVLLDQLRVHILTLGWLRRLQVAAYFEAGGVADRSNRLFRAKDTLHGVGLGLRFHVDLFGINPTVWRFDVAKRLDDYDGESLLFYIGAGQSF